MATEVRDTSILHKVVKIPTFPEVDKYVRVIDKEAKAFNSLVANEHKELNIPKIYDYSTQPPFVIEEFIEGGTLAKERNIHTTKD